MIKLENVSKFYASKDAVAIGIQKVNLELNIGEFVAVTGESGSGKSTFLNVISGIDSYEEGELLVNGEETSGYIQSDWEKFRNDYVSFVFQDYNIIESYTVLQNVEIALVNRFPDKKERRERALELIEKVGLTSHIKHKGTKLSGGQKQRVVIARALAKDSPIIMADEPTGNLDSNTGKEIIELLASMAENRLIIVVTHNFEQVETYATRKIRFFDGEVVEDRLLSTEQTAHSTPSTQSEQSPEFEVDSRQTHEAIVKPLPILSKSKKAENVLRIAISSLLATPKKTLFMVALFAFVTLALFAGAGAYNAVDDMTQYYHYSPSLFNNIYPDRRVIKNQDDSVFTADNIEDINRICDSVVYEDILLDTSFKFDCDDDDEYGYSFDFFNAYVMPISAVGELTAGRMPENDNEIVLASDVNLNNEDYLDKEYSFIRHAVTDYVEYSKLKVVGFVLMEEDNFFNYYVFATDATLDTLSQVAVDYAFYNEQDIYLDNAEEAIPFQIFGDSSVPSGTAKLSLLTKSAKRLDDLNAITSVNVDFSTPFSTKIKTLTVTAADTYDSESLAQANTIYVNPNDIYEALYGDGYRQATIFVADNEKSTVSRLEAEGFYVYDVTVDARGNDGYSDMSGRIYRVVCVIAFIALCLIMFGLVSVIGKKVITSKNRDYVIMRSIGIEKTITNWVLVCETWLQAIVAFIITGIPIWILCSLDLKKAQLLPYLTPAVSVWVLLGLLFVGGIVATRYNTRMFNSTIKSSLSNR